MTPRADALVLLGCRVLASGRPAESARLRAATAAAAYLAGIAPRVVVSGGRRWGQHVEALVLRRELVRAGVPESVVAVELCSMTTCENAFYSAELLRRRGARRVAVVTCAWHMPRALANFRAAGLDAVACASPPASSDALAVGSRWVHERVAERLDAVTMRRMTAMPRRKELREGTRA